MKLIKVKDGLLEVEKFYLTSSFSDFLGKDISYVKNGELNIVSNVRIKRDLFYNEFVLELKKTNWDTLNNEDKFSFYVETNKNDIYGIEDSLAEDQSEYQKIIYHDNYIQFYTSDDSKEWTNIGGVQLYNNESISGQGFQRQSDKLTIIKNYKIYSSPYIKLQNMKKNYKVELYDENNNLLKTRLFTEQMECDIYIDYCFRGYFKIYDIENNLIYTSELMDLQYGDGYLFTKYNLEVYYYNTNVTEESNTFLQNDDNQNIHIEIVGIKNASIEDIYTDLKISTYNYSNEDIITLSLDNETYTDSLLVDQLNPQEIIYLYIKIEKSNMNGNFVYRNFELLINKQIIKGLVKTLCDFNSSEKEIFNTDNYVTFDGKAYLQTDYQQDMQLSNNLIEGTVYNTELNKKDMKKYINFSLIDNIEEYPVLKYKAIPFDRVLIQQEDYILSDIVNINYFNLVGTQDNIKIVFSTNSGSTWLYFKNGQFKNLNKLDVENINLYGNTIIEFNDIKEKWNDIILNEKIRFTYLLTMDNETEEFLDSLVLNYDAEMEGL